MFLGTVGFFLNKLLKLLTAPPLCLNAAIIPAAALNMTAPPSANFATVLFVLLLSLSLFALF